MGVGAPRDRRLGLAHAEALGEVLGIGEGRGRQRRLGDHRQGALYDHCRVAPGYGECCDLRDEARSFDGARIGVGHPSERVTEGGAEQRAREAIEEVQWGGVVTKARGG